MNRKTDESELYRTALRVFSRYGFQRAKMSDVTGALGLASGTIYRYVRDKRELYHKTIAYGFTLWQAAVKEAVASFDDPLEKLVVLSFTGFSFLQGESDFLRILMEYPESLEHWADDDYIRDINRGSVGILRDIIAEGIASDVFRSLDPDIIAEAFFETYMLFLRKIYINQEGEHTWKMIISGLEVLIQGMIDRSIDEGRPAELLSLHCRL